MNVTCRSCLSVATVCGILLGAIASPLASQATNPQQYSAGVGVVQRDLRDYRGDVQKWGYSLSFTFETSYAHAALLVSGNRFRFANQISSPPLQTSAAEQGAAALVVRKPRGEGEWDPAQAPTGATDLTAYQLTLDYRRYVVPRLGLSGPYANFGLGLTSLSTSGMHDLRPVIAGAIGVTGQIARHVGVYAEARLDWLALNLGSTAKSPRWFGTPIRAGLVLRQ
jgi:hypothetical protein